MVWQINSNLSSCHAIFIVHYKNILVILFSFLLKKVPKNEQDFNYLESRKTFTFLKYL